MKLFRSILLLSSLLTSFTTFADDTFQTARFIGTLQTKAISFSDNVNANDVNDYFYFQVNQATNIQVALTNLTADASVGLYSSTGTMLTMSSNPGTQNESMSQSLQAGKYIVRVASWQLINNANYTLTISNKSIVFNPIPRPAPAPTISKIVIRGIPYNNHSPYSKISTNQVLLGDYFNIKSSTLNFNQGTVKVILQDVNTSGGFGINVYELKGINRYGNTIQVQAPWLQLFRNRTFHVSIFQYTGNENNYAEVGRITFQ